MPIVKPSRLFEDRFAIERLAGAGGMGKVYRACDQLTGRPVAVKVLQVQGALEAERFAREAEVLAGLEHPAIVRFVAHGRTPEGEPFLALEWLEGEDLGARLRREGLTMAESVTLAIRVAEGLGAAHRRGVVHRDIKPGNLWLVDGRPEAAKVLDFGIARLLRGGERGERTLTQAGAMIGTPGYMAPEQARGELLVDARADVFSLGCVLFKCLTGRRPFEGEDVMAVLLKLVLEEPPRLLDLCPEAPHALDRLLGRMLAKSPLDRPDNADEVARELAFIEPDDGDRAAPASRGSAAITATERPSRCVVLARFPVAESSHEGAETAVMPPAIQDAFAAALDMLGGELSVLADGSLLVTVTGGGAFTDQAVRAARAALALRARHPDAAIAVVTGRGEPAARLPMGEVIDRGVALLHRAAAGSIRVDEAIAGLVAATFELGGDEAGLLLAGERAREVERTLLGKATPFVGREHELLTLEALFDEVSSESVARAVIIKAPAGVGKSRLRIELVRRLRAHTSSEIDPRASRPSDPDIAEAPPRRGVGGFELWLGRGDAMRTGVPFGLLAPVLRTIAGVRDGEPAEVRRRKLSARIGLSLGGEARTRVAAFLGELGGVPFPDDASVELYAARQDPILMGDQMRRAFEDFLAAECAAGPVVILLDDVQWGDRPSLQVLDAALRNLADRPLLMVALARPGLDERFPGLWAGRPLTELNLSPLSRKASEKLVRAILGRAAPAVVHRIVQLAGGDAFYLEELIRAVAEGRGDRLPDTVLAMVEQRLDGLDARERRVLRAASVFGGVFWTGGVLALLGGDERTPTVSAALGVLVDRELLDRRPVADFPGHEEYAFRQTLVREAAYAMLTDTDRRLGHRLAGEWLERVGESDPGIVAEHFERAGEAERALSSYRRAAAQALEANDVERALLWIERALARLGDPAARGPDDPVLQALGALRRVQGEALRWSGDLALAEQSAAEAMRLLPRGSALWFLAVSNRATLAGRLGHHADLDALAADLDALWSDDPLPQHVIAAARMAAYLVQRGAYARADQLLARIAAVEPRMTEPAVCARIDQAAALRAQVKGDLGAYLSRVAAAVAHFSAAGDQRNACLSRITLAFAQTTVARYDAATRELREALATAERMALPSVSAYAKHTLGYALARLGALDEALAIEAEAIEAFSAIGDRRLEGGSRGYLAGILALAGDLDAAEREATTALALLDGVPPVRAFALATRAAARLLRGDVAGALSDAEGAYAVLLELGGIEEGEVLVRLGYAEALQAAGRHEEATAVITEARRRLVEQAAQISDQATRARFLEAVPENARTVALASAWAGAPSPA
jgi:tetratricopeptide (TPR) repeat protein